MLRVRVAAGPLRYNDEDHDYNNDDNLVLSSHIFIVPRFSVLIKNVELLLRLGPNGESLPS